MEDKGCRIVLFGAGVIGQVTVPEILYKYMFEVFLIISIIEAVSLIITVYMVRRIIADKANPRPKRV